MVFNAASDTVDAAASAALTSGEAGEGGGGGGGGARSEDNEGGWIQPGEGRERTHRWRVGTPGTVYVVGLGEGGGREALGL